MIKLETMQKSILTGLAFIALLFTFSSLKANDETVLKNNSIMSKFTPGEAYGLVRNSLIKSGWSPVISNDADECLKGDVRCSNRPEMEACSGAGVAPCKFVWRKGNQLLKVYTVGVDATDEGDAAFDSLELVEAKP